jgi:hypothetical protein
VGRRDAPKEKHLLLLRKSNRDRSLGSAARSLVTVPTAISQTHILRICKKQNKRGHGAVQMSAACGARDRADNRFLREKLVVATMVHTTIRILTLS